MSIKKFVKKCGLNYREIKGVYIQKIGDIEAEGTVSVADPDASPAVYHAVSTAPTFASGSGWGWIPFSKNTGKLTEALKGNIDAQSNDCTIVGIYPEMDTEAIARAQGLLGCEVMLVAIDAMGTKRQIGTLANPAMIMKFDFDSSIGGANVEIKWEADKLAPVATYAIVEI